MPKFFCDYCEINLKNDSYDVRKQHNAGRKHKENVRLYYEQYVLDEEQKMIDHTVQSFFAFKACGMTMPLYPMTGMGFPGAPPPMYPMQGMNGAPPMYPMQGMNGAPPMYPMQGMNGAPPMYPMQGMNGAPPMYPIQGMNGAPPMYPPSGPFPVSPGMSGDQAVQPDTNPGVYPPSMCPPVGVSPPLPANNGVPAVHPGVTSTNAAVSYPPQMCPPVGVPPPMTGDPYKPGKNGMTSPPTNMNGTAHVQTAASNAIPFPPTMGGVAPFPPVSYAPITASAYGFQHTNYRPNDQQSRCAPYKRPDNQQNNFHATGYNYNAVQ